MSEQPPDITGRIVAHRGTQGQTPPDPAGRLDALARKLRQAADGDRNIADIARPMLAVALAAGADDADGLLVNVLVWRIGRLDDEALIELGAAVEQEMDARTAADPAAGPSQHVNRSIPRGTAARGI